MVITFTTIPKLLKFPQWLLYKENSEDFVQGMLLRTMGAVMFCILC